jgi:hypothetical protein
MRRVYILIGIWFALAALTTVAFGSGPTIVKVDDWPGTVIAGQPYAVSVVVTRYGRRLHGQHPVVTISYPGSSFQYRATEAGHDGIYRVRVRVPIPGTWNYDVKVDGKTARRGTFPAKLIAP